MKLMKASLISSAFLAGLLMAGCSATPAAGPAGPQGPPGPQGVSDHDRDRDRDRDADQGRRDQATPCPGGQHHDTDGGCIRD
jgi:hypothetical protein